MEIPREDLYNLYKYKMYREPMEFTILKEGVKYLVVNFGYTFHTILKNNLYKEFEDMEYRDLLDKYHSYSECIKEMLIDFSLESFKYVNSIIFILVKIRYHKANEKDVIPILKILEDKDYDILSIRDKLDLVHYLKLGR